MLTLAIVFSSVSIAVSLFLLFSYARLLRRLREQFPNSPWDDELMTRDAWLAEMEARGGEILQRLSRAEAEALASLQAEKDGARSEKKEHGSGDDPEPEPAPAPGVDAVSASSVSTTTEEEDEQRADDTGQLRKQVHALADEGHDAASIARTLGRGRGEIELMLQLRR